MAKPDSSSKKGAKAQERAAANREIKSKLAKLKKRGLILKNKDLRQYTPTAYAKRRLKELEGILTGDLIAVKAPKAVQYKYRGVPNTDYAGGKVIVPNRPGARAQIRRGMIAYVEPLGNEGYVIEQIVLPVNLRRPDQVMRWLKRGDAERLKHPQEHFGFTTFGNASLTTLPNVESLIEYLSFYDWFAKPAGNNYTLNPSDDQEEPALVLYRVFPPEAWDAYLAEHRLEQHSSPGYLAAMERKREAKNRNRRIRYHRKKRVAKKAAGPTPAEKLAAAARTKAHRARVKADPAKHEAAKEARRVREWKKRREKK